MKKLLVIALMLISAMAYSQIGSSFNLLKLRPIETPSNPKRGMVYLNQADTTIYLYTGDAWRDIGTPGDLEERVTSLEAEVVDTADIGNYALLKEMEINAQTGTSYTLVLADAAKLVTMTNASANTCTVPPNSSVAFPTGTQVTIVMLGAGTTSIDPGSGVTVNGASADIPITAQYGAVTIIKTDTNTWLCIGKI